MAGRQETNVSQRSLRALLKLQKYRCALSGLKLTPEKTSLDHKVPVTRGGNHDQGNVWLVHADVNRAKGTLTVEEFVRLCERVAAHQRQARPATPTPNRCPAASEDGQMYLFEEHNHE
jgi:5-methylcytosine-specific restriction endonuclease McrA